jgi:type II secretory pathway component PulF
LLGQLNRAIERGSTVAEAFAAQRPNVSEMEAGIVAAVERAGRLDRGLTQLAAYFGALDAARSSALNRPRTKLLRLVEPKRILTTDEAD